METNLTKKRIGSHYWKCRASFRVSISSKIVVLTLSPLLSVFLLFLVSRLFLLWVALVSQTVARGWSKQRAEHRRVEFEKTIPHPGIRIRSAVRCMIIELRTKGSINSFVTEHHEIIIVTFIEHPLSSNKLHWTFKILGYSLRNLNDLPRSPQLPDHGASRF